MNNGPRKITHKEIVKRSWQSVRRKENRFILGRLTAVLPSWAGRDDAAVSSGEGSSDVLGTDISDWLMLLFVSLQNMSPWLLLELEEAFEARSSSGCFFWMSVEKKKRDYQLWDMKGSLTWTVGQASVAQGALGCIFGWCSVSFTDSCTMLQLIHYCVNGQFSTHCFCQRLNNSLTETWAKVPRSKVSKES